MSNSRPPGIRLHLGFYHAGDPGSPTGEIRARLPDDEMTPTEAHGGGETAVAEDGRRAD